MVLKPVSNMFVLFGFNMFCYLGGSRQALPSLEQSSEQASRQSESSSSPLPAYCKLGIEFGDNRTADLRVRDLFGKEYTPALRADDGHTLAGPTSLHPRAKITWIIKNIERTE